MPIARAGCGSALIVFIAASATLSDKPVGVR
jgi:hypothetical protein